MRLSKKDQDSRLKKKLFQNNLIKKLNKIINWQMKLKSKIRNLRQNKFKKVKLNMMKMIKKQLMNLNKSQKIHNLKKLKKKQP